MRKSKAEKYGLHQNMVFYKASLQLWPTLKLFCVNKSLMAYMDVKFCCMYHSGLELVPIEQRSSHQTKLLDTYMKFNENPALINDMPQYYAKTKFVSFCSLNSHNVGVARRKEITTVVCHIVCRLFAPAYIMSCIMVRSNLP